MYILTSSLRKKKQLNKLVEVTETRIEIDEDEQSLTKLDMVIFIINNLYILSD